MSIRLNDNNNIKARRMKFPCAAHNDARQIIAGLSGKHNASFDRASFDNKSWFCDALQSAILFIVPVFHLAPKTSSHMIIFISYSSKNRELVDQLADKLSEMGYTVLYDQKILAGQAWWDKILEDIRTCDVFIYALSPEYVDSY